MNVSPTASTVYSHIPSTVNSAASARFVLVTVDLIKRTDLSDAAFRQLVLMQSYTRVDQRETWAEQSTYANDLGCSVDKVQRNIAALAKVDLVTIPRRLRCTKGKHRGEYRQNVYDLSPVWAMLPAKTARKSPNQAAKLPRVSKPVDSQNPSTRPHFCGNSKYKNQDICKIEQQPTGKSNRELVAAPLNVVVAEINNEDLQTVQSLEAEGMKPVKALELVKKHGSPLCRRHLDAYRASKSARGVGWILSRIENGWSDDTRQTPGESLRAPETDATPRPPVLSRPLEREAAKTPINPGMFGTAPALKRIMERACNKTQMGVQ